MTKIFIGVIAALLFATSVFVMLWRQEAKAAVANAIAAEEAASVNAHLLETINTLALESERREETLAQNRTRLNSIIRETAQLKGELSAAVRGDSCAGAPAPSGVVELFAGANRHEGGAGAGVPAPRPE
jgi:hypothetical protein